MEEIILEKRKKVAKEQIEKDFEGWFSDSGFSRSRDTKVFRPPSTIGSPRPLLPKCLRTMELNTRKCWTDSCCLKPSLRLSVGQSLVLKLRWQIGRPMISIAPGTPRGPPLILSSLMRMINRTSARLPVIFKHPGFQALQARAYKSLFCSPLRSPYAVTLCSHTILCYMAVSFTILWLLF